MSDTQLITIVITLLAIGGGVYLNRKAVEDMRDVLRAEGKQTAAESKAALDITLMRIENKLDHLAETVAGHSRKLGE